MLTIQGEIALIILDIYERPRFIGWQNLLIGKIKQQFNISVPVAERHVNEVYGILVQHNAIQPSKR